MARERRIVSADEAASDVPAYEKTRRHADAQDPERASWGLKTGPKGQKYRGFGYKLHLSVAAGSLFPLAALTMTAKLHDVNMARPLVKITTDRAMGQQVAIFDAGYDQAALYQDLQAKGLIPIIPLNCYGGVAPEGRDDLGRPTCSMGYTLTLAGFDATTETQKFRCPMRPAMSIVPWGWHGVRRPTTATWRKSRLATIRGRLDGSSADGEKSIRIICSRSLSYARALCERGT